ncbi:MAG: glycosyltransferase family 39 protein [Spirochaetes bacterium]|nr:glycosyltransferase family 39 protein [Spirochaetota bacterium]
MSFSVKDITKAIPQRVITIALFAVLGLLFFNQIGNTLIKFFDDTFHITIIKDFALRGDILDLRDPFLGLMYFEKPPFMIVLSAAGLKLFGFNSFGAKIFIVLYCFLSLVIGYVVLRKHTSERTAILATIITGCAQQILHFSRRVGFDGVLAASLYIAFIFFYFAQERRWYYYMFGLTLGLAAMTKGVSGIIPVAALGMYLLVSPNGRARFRHPELYLSVIPFALVVAPWHIGMLMRHGDSFVTMYFWRRQMSYFLPGNMIVQNMPSWGWEVSAKKILENYWPALPLFIYGIYRTIRDIVTKRFDNISDLRLYALTWFAVIFAVYQAASVKRYAYILPVYGAMGVLAAASLAGRKYEKQVVIFFSVWALLLGIVSFTPLWKEMDGSGWEEHRPVLERLAKDGQPYALFPAYPGGVTWLYNGYAFHAPSFTNVSADSLVPFYTSCGRIVLATNDIALLPAPIRDNAVEVFRTNGLVIVQKK